MKKRYFIAPICLSLVTLIGVSLSMHGDDVLATNAASNSSTLFSDTFDSSYGLDESWENKGSSLTTDGYSLRIHPEKYIWGDFVSLNNFVIDKDTKVEFNVKRLNEGNWFAIGFGVDAPTFRFFDCEYAFVFANGVTETLKNNGSNLYANSTNFKYSPFVPGELNTYYRVTLDFHKINNEYFCNYSVNKTSDNTLIGSSSNVPLGDITGYLGFSDCLCSVELSSITITQSGMTVYSDDFSTSSISYPDVNVDNPTWNSIGFSRKDVALGRYGKLDLSKINTGVTFSQKLNNNDSLIDESYLVNMKISYAGMSEKAMTGYELTSSDGETYFFGLRKEIIGYALVCNKGNDTLKEVVCTTESYDGTAELSLSIHTYGEIVLNSDVSLSYKISFKEGYLSLYSRSNSEDVNQRGGYIDNFSISHSSYLKSDAKDTAINFNGTKTTMFDDREMHEYFINLNEWSMGNNVKVTPYTSRNKGNGYVVFSNSIADSAFGPRTKYTDYIARFDVTVTSTTFFGDSRIGLQFGKNKFNELYENCPSLGILYSPGQTLVSHTASTVDPSYPEGFVDVDSNPVDYFNGTLNFLYIVRDNKVEMHFKRSDEPDSQLSKIRAVAMVSSTYGYTAVFGSSGVSFNLDNLSITNLDYELTSSNYLGSEYQETARNDFSIDTSIKGFSLNNAEIVNNTLKISPSGTVTSLKSLKDNIVRFKVKSIGESLTVQQGSTKFIVSSDGSKVSYSVTDGVTNYNEELDNFSLLNATFEIRFASNKVEVRFVSGDSPLYNIDSNIHSYELSTSNDNVVITSTGGISTLSTLAIFNLDTNVTILNRDYNPDTDYFNPWPERPSIQDASKGCKGSINGCLFIGIISLTSVIVLLVIRRRRRVYEK